MRTVSRFHGLAIVTLVACAAAGTAASAADGEKLPDGFPVGPFILAPTFQLSYGYDDNVFRRPANDPLQPPKSDELTTAEGGLEAMLPFRQSLFTFGWNGSYFDYAKTKVPRNLEQEWKGQGQFRFGSGDAVRVNDTYTRGITRVQAIDEGFELTFDGQPFERNQVDLELSRQQPNRAGYVVRVSRIDFNFDRNETPSYFDYRGWDTSADFRHPLAGRRWLLAYVSARRFNHFDVAGQVGVPFRREDSGSVQVGFTGSFAGGEPYYVRLGYGRFRYALVEGPSFTGLVGTARARFAVGARSGIETALTRRPLPSGFDTYYVNDELELKFDRTWLSGSRIGLEGRLVRNSYAEPLVGTICDTFLRVDTRYRVEAFAEWTLMRRFIWRLSGVRDRRSSNCQPAEFSANAATVAVGFKWF